MCNYSCIALDVVLISVDGDSEYEVLLLEIKYD